MAEENYTKVDRDDEDGEERGKVVILHGFSPAQLHAVVEAYRKNAKLPQDVAFATVTPESGRRRLRDVVRELRADARAAAKRRASRSAAPSS
ncbi:DUF3783 domain-containing protein [Candidatus Poribacteria bacterium]|nr:DUF3783 domain-containing protein [Candidatus Poribacteria bacterium]MBT7100439.1 DUF3783 domain-containing protein [Candidatus Poribacteria bacterium]MBT7804699.1 DUF3783 domain-containing protein [Candidatus Poribacteria bacterium]